MSISCKDALRATKSRLISKLLKMMYLTEMLSDKLKRDFFEVGMNGSHEVNE